MGGMKPAPAVRCPSRLGLLYKYLNAMTPAVGLILYFADEVPLRAFRCSAWQVLRDPAPGFVNFTSPAHQSWAIRPSLAARCSKVFAALHHEHFESLRSVSR